MNGTKVVHTETRRDGAVEIEVEVSEWSGDDGRSKRTAKVQVWRLGKHKDYAIWLPAGTLPMLADMIDQAMRANEKKRKQRA